MSFARGHGTGLMLSRIESKIRCTALLPASPISTSVRKRCLHDQFALWLWFGACDRGTCTAGVCCPAQFRRRYDHVSHRLYPRSPLERYRTCRDTALPQLQQTANMTGFLDLPRELRDMVYEYHCSFMCPKLARPIGEEGPVIDRRPYPGYPTPLLHVSRQIRHEIIPVRYLLRHDGDSLLMPA